MKKALISPKEIIHINGRTLWRIAQVESVENVFDVCEPLYWMDCDDDVNTEFFSYDFFAQAIVVTPELPPPPPIGDAPNVIA
jgi:hypothetical protein